TNTCVDHFAPNTTVCRTANGQCDVAESCSAAARGGAADGCASNTTNCVGTSQSGACDVQDTWAGTTNTCVDHLAANTTGCRAGNGQCNVAERCTGSTGACPADGFASSTTNCVGTSQSGACGVQDTCAGTTNTCVDHFAPNTTVCRTANGQCDVAESCTGSTGACPADGFALATTNCVGTWQGGAFDGPDA